MLRRLILLILLLGLAAAGPARAGVDDAGAAPIVTRDLSLCERAGDGRGGEATLCRRVTPGPISLNGPGATLALTVDVTPKALRDGRPLMVTLVAMAASEVRWNGVLLGRSGRPGEDAAQERPGRLEADFVVPAALVRPGLNRVTARVSSHHLWLPIRAPLHYFGVGFYEDPARLGLTYYLPALIVVGVLGLACANFALLAALDRLRPDSALLAAIAGAAVAQLLVETARVFLTYDYPWHVARLAAVAGLSALTAVLIATWAAGRFAPRWRLRAPLVTALGAAIAIALSQGFDGKALGAVRCGLAALLACSALGARARLPVARSSAVAALAILALSLWQDAAFLDSGYYLSLAVVFAALVAGQARSLWRARHDGQVQAARAGELEARLGRVSRSHESVLLRDGARTHRVAPGDILFIKGADDYGEVHLTGGRTIMATMTLAELTGVLPDGFLRIHRSYIVNAAHIRTVGPRSGGGRSVTLIDGVTAPVGRTYAEAVRRWS